MIYFGSWIWKEQIAGGILLLGAQSIPEAVPLGRYGSRGFLSLPWTYRCGDTLQVPHPKYKGTQGGQVHLHLKHQQPWNQCLWKMGIRDCCQEDGHSAEEMVLRLSCLAYSHAILNRATKEMLLECQWDSSLASSQPSPGCASHTQ